MQDIALVLHNIRSAQNVGSIFRTADAAGVQKIYLSGYTPHPLDRFGRKRSDIAKTALGAEDMVPWEAVPDTQALLGLFREEGRQIVAVEQCADSLDYRAYTPSPPLALLFGNEVEGLPSDLIAIADAVIEIPMRGRKESLNVAVAAGVVLFRFSE